MGRQDETVRLLHEKESFHQAIDQRHEEGKCSFHKSVHQWVHVCAMQRKTTLSMLALFIKKSTKMPAKLLGGKKEFNNVVAEGIMKVKEELVQNEYNKEVVQHVNNMNQTNNWVDVPKDVEIWRRKWSKFDTLPSITGMYWTIKRWQKRLGARISRMSRGENSWGFGTSKDRYARWYEA